MPWFFAVAERDHEIQNPTSPEKIRLLGERLRLGPESHVLDIACGKGGPAVLLADAFGCRITGVERAAEFASVARERVAVRGLAHRIEIVEADAAELELGDERYDVAFRLQENRWNGTVAPQLVVRRVFDADDRFEEVYAWLRGQWQAEQRDGLAQTIFDELEVEGGGPRRHPLESDTFRAMLAEPALLEAA